MQQGKTDLEALAARVEAAEAADRNLDAMIHFAITNGIGCGMAQDAPAYSTSIDAALQLVPEGWRPAIDCTFDRPEVTMHPWRDELFVKGRRYGKAATPALALCAAALRARAQTPSSENPHHG